MKFIMVLNDGETFSSLDGCSIVGIPDHFQLEETEEALDTLNSHGDSVDIQVITVFQDQA